MSNIDYSSAQYHLAHVLAQFDVKGILLSPFRQLYLSTALKHQVVSWGISPLRLQNLKQNGL
jgi:hypothetical protein